MREVAAGGERGKDHIASEGKKSFVEMVALARGTRYVEFHHGMGLLLSGIFSAKRNQRVQYHFESV
jgi:hypothetical protein